MCLLWVDTVIGSHTACGFLNGNEIFNNKSNVKNDRNNFRKIKYFSVLMSVNFCSHQKSEFKLWLVKYTYFCQLSSSWRKMSIFKKFPRVKKIKHFWMISTFLSQVLLFLNGKVWQSGTWVWIFRFWQNCYFSRRPSFSRRIEFSSAKFVTFLRIESRSKKSIFIFW